MYLKFEAFWNIQIKNKQDVEKDMHTLSGIK